MASRNRGLPPDEELGETTSPAEAAGPAGGVDLGDVDLDDDEAAAGWRRRSTSPAAGDGDSSDSLFAGDVSGDSRGRLVVGSRGSDRCFGPGRWCNSDEQGEDAAGRRSTAKKKVGVGTSCMNSEKFSQRYCFDGVSISCLISSPI